MVNSGSFIINILKSIIMNIFIVFHSSNLSSEYKEMDRIFLLTFKILFYETNT